MRIVLVCLMDGWKKVMNENFHQSFFQRKTGYQTSQYTVGLLDFTYVIFLATLGIGQLAWLNCLRLHQMVQRIFSFHKNKLSQIKFWIDKFSTGNERKWFPCWWTEFNLDGDHNYLEIFACCHSRKENLSPSFITLMCDSFLLDNSIDSESKLKFEEVTKTSVEDLITKKEELEVKAQRIRRYVTIRN